MKSSAANYAKNVQAEKSFGKSIPKKFPFIFPHNAKHTPKHNCGHFEAWRFQYRHPVNQNLHIIDIIITIIIRCSRESGFGFSFVKVSVSVTWMGIAKFETAFA